MEKRILFSRHALTQSQIRGTSREEIELAIRKGERIAAKRGRIAFRKSFPFQAQWKGRYYESKQVMPIVVEENGQLVVVTVYVYFLGGKG